MSEETTMPIQPIKDNRFIPNRIVEKLLENALIDMNEIATMDFTQQERMQFAQLIGYSLSGFSELSYVDDETFYSCNEIANNKVISENEARIQALRNQIVEIKRGLKIAVVEAFEIHSDDLV